MSKWAIDATNRIKSEIVPGSSKYILREISEQFVIASTSIESRYLHVRDDANKLESWMKRVLEGEEDINDLLVENGLSDKAPPQLALSLKTNVPNFLPSPKSREVTIKTPLELLDEVEIENMGSGTNRRQVSGKVREGPKEFTIIKSFRSSESARLGQLAEETEPRTTTISSKKIHKIHPPPTYKHDSASDQGRIDSTNSPLNPIPPVTPKRSLYTASSDSEDSFEAISAAIKRSVLVKELDLGDKKGSKVLHGTPRRSSSKFVSLPARTPILLNRSARNGDIKNHSTKTPPTISIKNKFSPRKLPVKRNSPIPKLVKVPLRLESIVIPPTNSDSFVSSPTQTSNFEVEKDEHQRSSASLWSKIGEYRQLSPKKPPQTTPKRSPLSIVKAFKSRSPVRNSSPLRKVQHTSPAKVDIPQLKSPNLDRLAAPTIASAAKKKKPDSKKFENRFLTTTLQRTPRTFDRAKSTKVTEKAPKAQPKVDIQRSTKKSMMEQRSEAAALKSRQKIILNLRKSESKIIRDIVQDEAEQAPTHSPPKTPVKFTPDNLPDVLSDDNLSPSSKVLQPWGRTPELYKIAKSKKKVDPFKIFHKSIRVNLLEVFNKQVTAQSPAPTPDESQVSKYSKSMGFK